MIGTLTRDYIGDRLTYLDSGLVSKTHEKFVLICSPKQSGKIQREVVGAVQESEAVAGSFDPLGSWLET
jgi:hypothetical protein